MGGLFAEASMRFIHAVWVPLPNVSYTFFTLGRTIIGVAVVRPGAIERSAKGSWLCRGRGVGRR